MNKKLILMLSLVAASFAVKAQTKKGNQLLGGSLGLNFGKTTQDGNSSGGQYKYSESQPTFLSAQTTAFL